LDTGDQDLETQGILFVRHINLHAVMNFIISKCHFISENPIGEVEPNAFGARPNFEGDKNLEITDLFILVAFYALFMANSVVYDNLELESRDTSIIRDEQN
jgi:hypothetical protein